ncbi:hypothetical protein QQF64_005361 [Cirrhinus molitorella]|uniref:Uncharacterized protein n=1 Tax=Cirrhinus molitorella TaxID=172907 RepID=A0ABR3MBV4_9TELE
MCSRCVAEGRSVEVDCTGVSGELMVACLCAIQLLSTAVTQGLTWLYIPAVSYKTSSDLSLEGLLLFV